MLIPTVNQALYSKTMSVTFLGSENRRTSDDGHNNIVEAGLRVFLVQEPEWKREEDADGE